MFKLLSLLFVALYVAFVNGQANDSLGGALYCEGCHLLVGAIEKWIASNTTETMIEHKLEQLCTLLPKYGDICKTMITIGIPKIISYIEQYETPERVCQQLGFCPLIYSSPVVCEGCHLLVNAIEQWIKLNVTESEIDKKLDRLCALLPKYETICDEFVFIEVKDIIDLLEKYETPEQVCKQLKICV